ncbi:hypothetical protein QWY97_13475 [Vibrio cortegadensis]|uniref:hypothetical protein n=1 Tax=Vibrio cortegadensis TaxID=1328770 RepID=UPI0021C31C77|nr:hypothetical protein [Vibrio cortegadensis]MDN3698347.1 hypothetical protein [Vibrio cortegadensis]
MDANLSFIRLDSQLEPISSNEYETRLISIISSIESMLDISLIKDGKANRKHPLGKVIVEIVNLHIQGNFYNRDIELKRLFGFVNDLNKIKDKSESHFMQHRKLLRTCTRLSQFVGLRFEVNLSAIFVSAGLKYKNRESPDFEFNLKTSGETAFIESTSCHFTQLRHGDMYKKIASAIRTKSAYAYANRQTILAVDFTNVMHSAVISGSEFKVDELVGILSEVIDASDYGAFIFTGVHTNPNDGWLYSGGDAYIKDTASKGVIELYSALGWADKKSSLVEHGTVFSY